MKKFALSLALLAAAFITVASAENEDAVPIAKNKELVVLLHGLGRSASAMWLLASRLEDEGYHVERIGYSSLTQTPQQILTDVSLKIQECCAAHPRAVHFVGHSFGGLLVRAYLQENKPSNLGRVVLMGTPNQGTEIVDAYRDRWWMQLAGPTALALGTDDDSFPNSLSDPYYPVGVIAGARERNGTTSEILPGRDDGLVSVASTRLNGMTDFVVVDTGHASMRYSKEVAALVITFLNTGSFRRAAVTTNCYFTGLPRDPLLPANPLSSVPTNGNPRPCAQ
ncbi:MAG: alpha/beta fold hydrolase [Saprospiraceae bacterium]|nr:alpha/beta fold hydrolase [Saprospiraceae bacterium]